MALASYVMTSPLLHKTEEAANALNVDHLSISTPMVHVLHAKNIVELKEMESNVDRINVKIDRS